MTDFRDFCQNRFMPKSTRSKEEIYFMVLNAILKMEIAKGHLKWTLSDISRESKVTRSLIYYYFGKEKKAVLATAYQYLVERFYSLDKPNPLPLRQRLSNILKDLKEMPYLILLFYSAKGEDSEFGRIIRKKETEFLKGLQKEFPHLSETQILEVYLMELGAMLYHLPPTKTKDLFELHLGPVKK